MSLVFDIETIGFDFESLSESQKEYLLRYAEKETDEELREEKIAEAKRYTSLYPFTAEVAAIGMLNTDTENSMVLYAGDENGDWKNEEKKIEYKSMPEKEMLEFFWSCAAKVDRVVTFNGRCFDIPFLMLRSSVLKIKPSHNFLGSRFSNKAHVDLLEEFTFHGLIRKFNLDFYCRSYGIESPKSKGVTGMDVKQLFDAGRKKDLAIYCGDDIIATYELFKIWKTYLDI